MDIAGIASGQTGDLNSGAASVRAGQFMKLLATQLAHQDPLTPMENGDFAAQLAQFSSLEESQAMRQSMDEFLSLQRIGQASTLIGQEVEYRGADGQIEHGLVDSVRLEEGQLVLDVGGDSVEPGAVLSIRRGLS